MSFSDCHVTSPYNINALFNRHVVRIGKRISQRIYLHLTQIPLSCDQGNVYQSERRITH